MILIDATGTVCCILEDQDIVTLFQLTQAVIINCGNNQPVSLNYCNNQIVTIFY